MALVLILTCQAEIETSRSQTLTLTGQTVFPSWPGQLQLESFPFDLCCGAAGLHPGWFSGQRLLSYQGSLKSVTQFLFNRKKSGSTSI